MSVYRKTSVSEIAGFLCLKYEGVNITINGVSSYSDIKDGTLCFTNANLIKSNKHALLICNNSAVVESSTLSIIRLNHPRYAFAQITSDFLITKPKQFIHDTVIIHPHTDIAENVGIGPFSIIEVGVKIGKNSSIGNHVTLKAGTEIGENTIIKSGSIIGDQGFGFGFSENKEPKRINHSGGVIIGDEVEVGANSVICSGTIQPTILENYVKIDDLVLIAHNCHIGSMTMIISGAVVCGSVSIGSRSWIGPNSSIIDGKSVGSNVKIGIGAVITEDVMDGTKMMGINALPLKKLVKVRNIFLNT
jgi:UDP-3-O-[3-hydroxymyristoyl] glucosamine N-acyltransferase LpxD